MIAYPKFSAALALTMLAYAAAMHAQHPLETWGGRDVPGLTANLNSIAFGNEVFVAVGGDSTIARSPDGREWTVIDAGNVGDLARVRFLNGEFVVLGSTDQILFSSDGTAWTARTLPAAGFWDVAAGHGVYVLAGSTTFVSSNAVDWIQTHPMLTHPFPEIFEPYETALDSVVFGNGAFVALPTGGLAPGTGTPRPSLRSTNGIDWVETSVAPGTDSGGTGNLLFADGLFLGSGIKPIYAIYVSTNEGLTWCCAFNAGGQGSGPGAALAHGQGHYVVVLRGDLPLGVPTIFSSTNGVDWLLRYTADHNRFARAAAFGHGTFVVVGEGGSILQSGNLGGAPLILQQPEDRGAVVGNPATFTVQSSGALPLSYQWFFNGTTIMNATNAAHTIPSVTTSNAGSYQVVITNSFGSATSRVAQLTASFLNIHSYAGLEILGVPGRTYRIDATPANGPLNWQTLTNLVLPANRYIWIDYGSPAAGARLYRAAELP